MKKEVEQCELEEQSGLAIDAAFWKSLFSITSEQVMMINTEGIILFSNKGLFDVPLEATIGKSVYQLVPAAYGIILENKLNEINQTGKQVSFETIIKTKQGKKNLELTIDSVRNEHNQLLGYCLASVDTTSIKEARKKYNVKSNLENLFLNISAKFISLPAQEIDAGINEALELLSRFTEAEHAYIVLFEGGTGKVSYQWHATHQLPDSYCLVSTVQKLIGQTVYQINDTAPVLIPPHHPEYELENDCPILITPMVLEKKRYGAFVLVGRVKSQDNWAQDFIKPMSIFSNVFINTLERKKMSQVEDMRKEALEQAIADRTLAIELQNKKLEKQATELAKAEALVRKTNKQLKQANLQLEQTIEERTSSLKKTNQELDRFVYSVSHDIKAPLASVKGLINLIRLSPPEELETNLHLMDRSIDKLNGFVGDILMHSRNSRVAVKKDVIDFAHEIELAAEGLRHMEFASHVELITSIIQEGPVVTDQYRLQSVLKNLVSNAVKYHNPKATNSWVKVEVNAGKKHVQFTVSDNGIGIREECVNRVFDMFYRASENSFGSGLGLYIVKETVEKLGGTIGVTSEENKGTTFTVTFPNLA